MATAAVKIESTAPTLLGDKEKPPQYEFPGSVPPAGATPQAPEPLSEEQAKAAIFYVFEVMAKAYRIPELRATELEVEIAGRPLAGAGNAAVPMIPGGANTLSLVILAVIFGAMIWWRVKLIRDIEAERARGGGAPGPGDALPPAAPPAPSVAVQGDASAPAGAQLASPVDARPKVPSWERQEVVVGNGQL
jgi:hypothetical protein